MKKIIFWQQRVNIHEAGLISGLTRLGYIVYVIAQEGVSPVHDRMGVPWPDYGGAKLISEKDGFGLLEGDEFVGNDCIHVLTGLRSFVLTKKVFDYIKNTEARIVVMAECRDFRGLKGLLRYVDTRVNEIFYGSRLEAFFAVGTHAVKWYGGGLFSPKKVHNFGWFVDENFLHNINLNQGDLLLNGNSLEGNCYNIIFVGQLELRKGIDILISALSEIKLNFKIHVIGDGSKEKDIKILANNNDKFIFHGKKSYEQVFKYMCKADLLVLPSRFDGWGAVVVEALHAGCRVICSNNCGAELLADNVNIFKYRNNSASELNEIIQHVMSYGKLDKNTRKNISDFAKNEFGAIAVARYFIEKIEGKNSDRYWGDSIERKKISINYHFLPHYRAGIFEEINNSGLDVKYFSSGKVVEGIPVIKNFERAIIENSPRIVFGKFSFQFKQLLSAIKDDFDVFVYLSDINIVSTWFAALIVRVRRRRVIFWGHGYKSRPNNSFEKFSKKLFYSLPNVFFAYGERGRAFWKEEGHENYKYVNGFNSLNHKNNIIIRENLIKNSKLVDSDVFSILILGRLNESLEIDVLLDVLPVIAECCDCRLSINVVGDGPMFGKLDAFAQNCDYAKFNFYGNLYVEEDVASVIWNSDLVVLPGKVGLAAVHALTFGVPVITNDDFDRQMPEVEIIKHRYNGSLYKHGRSESLAEEILWWAREIKKDKNSIRVRCFEMVDCAYNPKNQLNVFLAAIKLAYEVH